MLAGFAIEAECQDRSMRRDPQRGPIAFYVLLNKRSQGKWYGSRGPTNLSANTAVHSQSADFKPSE